MKVRTSFGYKNWSFFKPFIGEAKPKMTYGGMAKKKTGIMYGGMAKKRRAS